MKLYLQAAPDGVQLAGPMAGHRGTYMTRLGVPVGVMESDDAYARLRDVEGALVAKPGMVVCEMRTQRLYAIDADYQAVLLPIKAVDAKIGLSEASDQISVYTEGQVAEILNHLDVGRTDVWAIVEEMVKDGERA